MDKMAHLLEFWALLFLKFKKMLLGCGDEILYLSLNKLFMSNKIEIINIKVT